MCIRPAAIEMVGDFPFLLPQRRDYITLLGWYSAHCGKWRMCTNFRANQTQDINFVVFTIRFMLCVSACPRHHFARVMHAGFFVCYYLPTIPVFSGLYISGFVPPGIPGLFVLIPGFCEQSRWSV